MMNNLTADLEKVIDDLAQTVGSMKDALQITRNSLIQESGLSDDHPVVIEIDRRIAEYP